MLLFIFVFCSLQTPLGVASPPPAPSSALEVAAALRTNENCTSISKKFSHVPKKFEERSFLAVKFLAQCYSQIRPPERSQLWEEIISQNWSPEIKSVFEKDLARISQFRSLETPDPLDDALALERLAPFEKNIHEKEKLLQEALNKIPSTPEHAAIKDRVQKTLWNHSPRLDPEALKTQPFVVARNHRAWREFDSAMNIYRKIYHDSSSPFQQRLEALKNKRSTLRSQQKKKDVIELDTEISNFLRKMLKSSKEERELKIMTQAFADQRLEAARAVWTDGKGSQAKKMIESAIEELQDKAVLDEHHFVLGRMSEEKKLFREALEHYSKIHNSEGDPTLYRRTLWAKAWMHLKLAEFSQAQSDLSELIYRAQDLNEKLRAQFWLAEAFARAGQQKDSRNLFKELSETDPFGYYGLLARSKLGKKFQPLRAASPKTKSLQLSPALIQIHPELARSFQILAAFQWRDNLEMALNEFKPLLEGHLRSKKTKLRSAKKIPDAIEKTASLKPLAVASAGSTTSFPLDPLEIEFMLIYAKAGIYLPLFSNTAKLEAEQRNRLLKTHPEILFPLDYIDFIEPAAKKNKIPKELVLSIIRQESAFNPLARSHAEAYGLMQMLPKVAQETGNRIGLKMKDATDLYEPSKNIELGSAFLSDLLVNRWKGKFVPAVASYNASPRAVQTWIEVRYQEDPLIFIEDVPYEETRGYIKLVLRNYILYKQLLSKESFSFPSAILKIKDPPIGR